jgi:AbiV family abortive infection protein
MSKLTLQQLDIGVEAAVANATSLIEEAELLYRSNFHARAYTLAHIAREEIAKVTMFYAAGLRILAGKAVDWEKLHKRLRDHNSKLTSDALLSFISTPGAVDTLPLEKMLGGAKTRNQWKNDSLYVSIVDGSFKTPSEMITRKKSERTIALAQFALVETKRYLTAGGKLSKRSPEEAKKIFSSIDPDKMSPTDGLALVKELAKLLQQHAINRTR